MQIQVSHFDQKGTIGTDVLDLSAEQLTEIVNRARDLAMLRRAGKPIARALDSLDEALISANVLKGDEQPADDAAGKKAAQAPQLLDAFRDLQSSAVAVPDDDELVTVSRSALAGVGEALRAAVTAGAQLKWEWKAVHDGHAEVSSDRVLERMATIVKESGAPSLHEIMTRYPTEFCQAYESLVEEDQRARAAGPGVTTVVHLDGEDGETMVSMVAPPGMNSPAIQAFVEKAVSEMSTSDDVDTLHDKLIGAGFAKIDHVTVSVVSEKPHQAPGM